MSPLRTPGETTDGKGGLFGNVDSQSRHAAHLKAHANAYAERFVRSIKESCLERLILFGEESLRIAVQNFIAHYHHERNHQGLDNRLINPELSHTCSTGEARRRQRLGGMLNYYYRAAA
jgi:transposase InsO family protein